MVSTLDFESSDPSSNLGRTFILFPSLIYLLENKLTPWRNGSASDSRSEGCVFESRRGHNLFSLIIFFAKKLFASNEDWTHDLWFTRPTLCHWAIEAFLIFTLKILVMLNDILRMYKCLHIKWPWLSASLNVLIHYSRITFQPGLNGLGVWFSLWVREVPGSNPGWALQYFVILAMNRAKTNIYLYLLNSQVWPGATILVLIASGRGGRVVKALDC